MDLLEHLFATGRIADIAILILIAEAAILIAVNRTTGGGLSSSEVVTNAAAGIFLFLAVRFALTDASWHWLAAALAAALFAHVADLRSRWRRR